MTLPEAIDKTNRWAKGEHIKFPTGRHVRSSRLVKQIIELLHEALNKKKELNFTNLTQE